MEFNLNFYVIGNYIYAFSSKKISIKRSNITTNKILGEKNIIILLILNLADLFFFSQNTNFSINSFEINITDSNSF